MADEYYKSSLTGAQIEAVLSGINGIVGVVKRKNDGTFEAAALYEILTGANAPTTSTVGVVNQMYRTSTDLYICTAVNNTVYTWTKFTKAANDIYAVSYNEVQALTDVQKAQALNNISAGRVVLSGSSNPTTSTVGVVNQFYRNTSTNKVYVCTNVSNGSYTWVMVNDPSSIPAVLYSGEQGLSESQKSVALANISAGREVLSGSSNPTTSTVGVLNQLYRNTTSHEVFICIGVSGSTYSWISLLYGTAVFTTTQSLTESQKDRLLSNISAGREVLSESTDPTTSTVGKLNQLYRNTTSNAVFICTSIADSIYTWTALGGGSSSSNYVSYGESQSLTESQKATATSNIGAGRSVLEDSGDPTSSTVGIVNQFYRNTASNDVFICTSASDGSYSWVKVTGSGGTGGAVDSVNGQTGTVVLEADDIDYDSTNTVKDKIDSKLDSNLGSTYSGYILMVGSDGAITPQQYPVWSGGSY